MGQKKKRRRQPVDPLHVFVNARGFQVAAAAIDAQGPIPALLWPKASCAAFSLELYLKCLHRVRRRYAEGHDSQVLFSTLSIVDRKRIEEIYDEVIKHHPNYADFIAADILLDINSVLTRASNMFIKGRYWHELELPKPDAKGMTTNVGIDRLCDAIKMRIFEIHPEYPTRASNFEFTFAGIPLPAWSRVSRK